LCASLHYYEFMQKNVYQSPDRIREFREFRISRICRTIPISDVRDFCQRRKALTSFWKKGMSCTRVSTF